MIERTSAFVYSREKDLAIDIEAAKVNLDDAVIERDSAAADYDAAVEALNDWHAVMESIGLPTSQ